MACDPKGSIQTTQVFIALSFSKKNTIKFCKIKWLSHWPFKPIAHTRILKPNTCNYLILDLFFGCQYELGD